MRIQSQAGDGLGGEGHQSKRGETCVLLSTLNFYQVTHLPMPIIKKISCGPNHTVAVDENNKVNRQDFKMQ